MPLFYFIWKHVVYDSANQEFSVFCDLDSEPGFIRTLVQSFSLENTDIFRGKRFRLNLPLNFDSRNSMSVESRSSGSGVDRTMYRMSSLQMQSFGWPLYTPASNLQLPPPPHGLKKTDYARAKLKNHALFGTFSYQCLHYEYINIRGISCENCTAATKQGNLSSWTSSSYKSKTEFGCDFDGSPGVNGSENNFGLSIKHHQLRPSLFVVFCLHNSALAWICLQLVNLRFKNGK